MSLLTDEERRAFIAAHGPAGLSVREIAELHGVAPSTAGRWLSSAVAKVDQMKAFCADVGGDPGVVEQYLAELETNTAARL